MRICSCTECMIPTEGFSTVSYKVHAEVWLQKSELTLKQAQTGAAGSKSSIKDQQTELAAPKPLEMQLASKYHPLGATWFCLSWYFSDRASWIDYILITNLMHWLLFIHKILFSSTCFEPKVLIFRRIQLYTCRIWYCHSLWEFLVACRCTAWVRTQALNRQATRNSHREWQYHMLHVYNLSSWRWALEARNM